MTALLGTRRLSRRRYLLLMAGLDLEGWILIATAQNFAMVVAGRFLHGLAAAGYIPSIQVGSSQVRRPHIGPLVLKPVENSRLTSRRSPSPSTGQP